MTDEKTSQCDRSLFSTRGDFALPITGDIRQYPETFLVVTIEGGEVRDVIKHPIIHKTAPTTKICLAQNGTSMDLENPCVKLKLDCKIKHIRGGTKE